MCVRLVCAPVSTPPKSLFVGFVAAYVSENVFKMNIASIYFHAKLNWRKQTNVLICAIAVRIMCVHRERIHGRGGWVTMSDVFPPPRRQCNYAVEPSFVCAKTYLAYTCLSACKLQRKFRVQELCNGFGVDVVVRQICCEYIVLTRYSFLIRSSAIIIVNCMD